MPTATDYLYISSVGRSGLWVQLVSNTTGLAYVSTAATDNYGKYSISAPAGTYTLYTGSSPTGPWAPSGDTNYVVSDPFDKTFVANPPIGSYGSKSNVVVAPTNVNLQVQGADMSGGTTSDAAWIAAKAALPSGGGKVYVPPGLPTFANPLDLPSNVTLEGDGQGGTTVRTASATGDVITATGVSKAKIKYLSLDSTVTRTAGNAIKFSGASQCDVEYVDMANQFVGVEIDGASSVIRVSKGKWINFVPTNGIGALIQGGNDHYFSEVVIDNPNASQPFAGMRVLAVSGLWVRDIDFIHSGKGFLSDPGAGQTVEALWMTACAFDTCSDRGIYLRPASATAVMDSLHWIGCWAASNTADGLLLDSAAGASVGAIRFVALRLIDNGQHGANLFSSVYSDVDFDNCDFSGNSNPNHGGTSGLSSGVHVAAGVSGWSVRNSRSRPMANRLNSQAWGILVDAGASANYTIENNDVRGNVTGGISDGGTGVGRWVKANKGYAPVSRSGAAGASPWTYTNNDGYPEILMLTAVNGLSAMTYKGTAAAITLGIPYYLNPDDSMVLTWATTAPTIQIIPVQ